MLEYVASCNLASAEWLRGRLAEAERAFEPSLARWANEPTVPIWGRHVFAQIQLAQVHLDAAVQTCQRALAVTAPPGRPPLPAAGPAHVCLGEVSYRRDQLDTALDHVTAGIALCRRLAYTPPLAAGLVTLAWIRQARGDPAGATEAMGSATQLSPGPDGLLNPVPAHWARLLLAHGDLGAAADWVIERGLSADDEPEYPREQGYLVLARVLVAQDQPDRALTLLTGCKRPRTASIGRAAWSPLPSCGRWPWRRPATNQAPTPAWPRRSTWPVRRGGCGCSPTRGRPWRRW